MLNTILPSFANDVVTSLLFTSQKDRVIPFSIKNALPLYLSACTSRCFLGKWIYVICFFNSCIVLSDTGYNEVIFFMMFSIKS